MVAGCSQYGQHSTFITMPNTIQGRARSICSVLHSWPSHLKRACPRRLRQGRSLRGFAMIVHEFLEHRTAPARQGNPTARGISPIRRAVRCAIGHIPMTGRHGRQQTYEEITKPTKSPKKTAGVALPSADAPARGRSCIVDPSSGTEPASVRVVPPPQLLKGARRPAQL